MIRLVIPEELARAVGATPSIRAADAQNLFDCLGTLENRYPGLRRRLLEVDGFVRQHLNVFVDDRLERGRDARTIALCDGAEVWIMRAVSGG